MYASSHCLSQTATLLVILHHTSRTQGQSCLPHTLCLTFISTLGFSRTPPLLWPHRALFSLFSELGSGVCSGVAAVAFDGTSSTALLVDEADAAALAAGGAHLALPKLYNETQVSSAHLLRRHGCRNRAPYSGPVITHSSAA